MNSARRSTHPQHVICLLLDLLGTLHLKGENALASLSEHSLFAINYELYLERMFFLLFANEAKSHGMQGSLVVVLFQA